MVYFVRRRRPAFVADVEPDEHGLVAVGGTLDPETLLEAYSKGIFPWSGDDPIPWFSPDPRLVLDPSKVHVARSLEKVLRRGTYEVRFDQAFETVMTACAATPRPGQDGTWIGPNLIRAYTRLFDLGVAHCVEVYSGGTLVGGLYGLSLGRAFFGESMFAWAPDASKVALVTLCRALQARSFDFIDCQQDTPHLRAMGAVTISRQEYLQRLAATLKRPGVKGPWTSWGASPVADG